jgi:hypothetical protein
VTVERVAGIGAFAVVVAGLAIGFASIGPPQHMRGAELDRQRVADLRSIATRIHHGETGRPPGPVTVPLRRRDDWPRDPETGQPYDYTREGPSRYRLCATFALAGEAEDTDAGVSWRHASGRTCYRLDATTDELRPERIVMGPGEPRAGRAGFLVR